MPLIKVFFAMAIVAGVASACFTDKPSASFECGSQADCSNGRQCVSGYCVVPQCPADCSSCDEVKHTCVMDCSSTKSCGSVTCPTDWSCTINCIGDGACSSISCATGSTCNVTCSGTSACGNVSCRDACACDLTCPLGACDTISCPVTSTDARCTTDGTSGKPCVSSPAGCTKC